MGVFLLVCGRWLGTFDRGEPSDAGPFHNRDRCQIDSSLSMICSAHHFNTCSLLPTFQCVTFFRHLPVQSMSRSGRSDRCNGA